MTTLNAPYTKYQMSSIGVGAVATGLADIKQCIDFILRTIPGSCPFRPLFGSNIYRYIDREARIAIPNIKKEIFEALDLWEPRITIQSITHETASGHLIFKISFKVIDDGILSTLEWSANGVIESSGSTSGVILSAVIPTKITNGRYKAVFNINGDLAYPVFPSAGFGSAADLLTWVSANWFNYGAWYIAGDKLVLYMKNGIANSANLTVTQTVFITDETEIPKLGAGEYYSLILSLDGIAAVPVFPISTFSSVGGMISWLQTYWGSYGTFSIVVDGFEVDEGDYTSDYSSDFDTYGVIEDLILVFTTDQFTTASIEFI